MRKATRDAQQWFDTDGQALVKAANAKMQAYEAEFAAQLTQSLADLRQAMKEERRADAAVMAYELSSRAGSVGWPLVSVVARWLRQILEDGKENCLDAVPTLALGALELLSKNQYRGEHPEGQILLRETHALLVKKGYHPA